MKKKKIKKKIDWSKIFSSTLAIVFGVYGILCGVAYYRLSYIAIENCATPPDPTLAVTCVTVVIGSLISYLAYNSILKTSRNKHKVDAEGIPFELNQNLINSLDGNLPINGILKEEIKNKTMEVINENELE